MGGLCPWYQSSIKIADFGLICTEILPVDADDALRPEDQVHLIQHSGGRTQKPRPEISGSLSLCTIPAVALFFACDKPAL